MPYRLMYRFWLDINKSEEELIADKIETLKNERNFSSVIRDGIRLICNLRDGKLDVLFELFPWVRAEFLQYMREIAIEAVPTANESTSQRIPDQQLETERVWLEAEQERIEQERVWQERRIEEARQALEAEKRQWQAERTESQSAIQKQLARLEELLLSQGHQPIDRPIEEDNPYPNRGKQSPDNSGGPKRLNVQQLGAPKIEDEDEEDENLLEVKKDISAGKRATQNFLNSLMSLKAETEQPPKQ